jgi:hypothetical protein
MLSITSSYFVFFIKYVEVKQDKPIYNPSKSKNPTKTKAL